MKKIILASIGLSIVGFIAYAVSTTTDVSSVIIKTTGNGATKEQRTVSALDFNTIIDTVKGIFTQVDPGSAEEYNIGLNADPVDGVDLNINGVLRMKPFDKKGLPAVCEQETSGMMYFNDNNSHFWGCEGSTWKQLDVVECASVDGTCDNSVENTCTTGTLNDIADSGGNSLWECLGQNGGTDDTSCSKPKPVLVNGTCGKSLNTCSSGNLNDTADSSTDYLWECVGTDGGSTESCSEAKPVFYSCTKEDPKYAELCKNDDKDLKSDTNKIVVSSCTESVKCEYVCDKEYALNKDKGICEKK